MAPSAACNCARTSWPDQRRPPFSCWVFRFQKRSNMTDNYVVQVESAVKAIRVHGLRSFSWFNQREHVLEPALERRLPLEVQQAHFCDVLGSKLYANFYCLGFATPLQH